VKKLKDLKNYRLKYKRYYGVEFDSNYDVHHIDGNHENNKISNLLLLPKDLHQKYHELTQKLHYVGDLSKLTISKLSVWYTADLLMKLCEVLMNIRPWVARQEFLQLTIKEKQAR
jgi:hypothetical protein